MTVNISQAQMVVDLNNDRNNIESVADTSSAALQGGNPNNVQSMPSGLLPQGSDMRHYPQNNL